MQPVWHWIVAKILSWVDTLLQADPQARTSTAELQKRAEDAEKNLAVAKSDLVWMSRIRGLKMQEINHLKTQVKEQQAENIRLQKAGR